MSGLPAMLRLRLWDRVADTRQAIEARQSAAYQLLGAAGSIAEVYEIFERLRPHFGENTLGTLRQRRDDRVRALHGVVGR